MEAVFFAALPPVQDFFRTDLWMKYQGGNEGDRANFKLLAKAVTDEALIHAAQEWAKCVKMDTETEANQLAVFIECQWHILRGDWAAMFKTLEKNQIKITKIQPSEKVSLYCIEEEEEEEEEEDSSELVTNLETSSTQSSKLKLLCKWTQILNQFFFNLSSNEKEKEYTKAVKVLQEMRSNKKKKFNPTDLKKSGLADIINKIAHPSTKLEMSAQLRSSFQKHRWKETLSICLEAWYPTTGLIVDNLTMKNPDLAKGLKLSQFSRNFFTKTWTEFNSKIEKFPVSLQVILQCTKQFRDRIKKVKKKISSIHKAAKTINSPNSDKSECYNCRNLPEDSEDRCERIIYITKYDVDSIQGKTNHAGDGKYHPLKMLPSIKISSRSEVYKRCGRDIVHFKDTVTQKEIGGVQFHALPDHAFHQLQKHHSDVAIVAENIRRGNAFQSWNHGQMKAVGTRVAQGGRAGDAYAAYPSSSIDPMDTKKHVEALFSHGEDTTVLLAVLEKAAPHVFLDIKNAVEKTGTGSLGRYGLNSFYCWNYVAPQHKDKDFTWTISTQLFKRGPVDEYNFSFTQWGIYIQTEENTVWWFNGRDMHGTIVPRQSSITSSDSISHGIVCVLRQKDANAAKEYRDIRQGYNHRVEMWKKVDVDDIN
ncbi:hypothetical protein BD410DRAFT_809109 [Rickenella mellea]|uniref:Uncharacterized protein n=1 Tax=Rickenella mellea TaxID=50990 RepID=A0A4Y7PL00_9AGAM|nr:hypothetical protein BD410DRAFT_809109 [Rickenella mellea]